MIEYSIRSMVEWAPPTLNTFILGCSLEDTQSATRLQDREILETC
jgi:hypothetical protein